MTEPTAWRRLRTLWRRDVRAEVDDEVAFHLEMRARELVDAGWDPALARREAERRFGAVREVRDACVEIDQRRRRHERRVETLMDFVQDARLALRTLRRSPAFALVATLTLALGIGATTAIFSVVEAALLRPYPYPEPDRLVVPQSYRRGAPDRWYVTYMDFRLWRQAGVFDKVALVQTSDLDLTGEGAPVRATTAIHTSDFFAVLRVRPLLGRLPLPDEYRPGSNRPIVISYGLWQRHFGGAPDVIGKSVRMTGIPVTVVGVLPRGTEYPRDADMWYPYRGDPGAGALAPDNFEFTGVARLAPGRSLEDTRERLAALARPLETEFPAKRRDVSVTATPFRDFVVGERTATGLWVLLGAVGFVLLVACVNIANLMLARAAARERELAVRTALGAGRGRLVRQLLTESLVLAAAGGAVGLLLAAWGTRALVRAAPAGLVRLGEVRMSLPVLAAAAAATLLSALLFGLVPALTASSASPGRALGERSSRLGGRSRRTAALLVVVEVALSLTLLSGAGLLTRSLMRLHAADTGLDTRRVLTFDVVLPQSRYDSWAKRRVFWLELRRRLEALPGVRSASVSSNLPLGGGGFYLGRTLIENGMPEPPAGREVSIMWNMVSPGYFATMGQRLVAGRDFTDRDDSTAAPAIVVTRRFAEAMFPGVAPAAVVGKRVFSWRDERLAREIVGVAADVRFGGPADTAAAVVYVPLLQTPTSNGSVALRADGDAAALTAAARRTLTSLEPDVAMARVQTMDDVLADVIAPQRFTAALLVAFASLAVVLAAVGLYGLLAYGVAQRTREIGLRMALGAQAGGVMRLVLGRSLGLVLAGAALGLGGALAVSRTLRTLLFEVRPTDPTTLAAVTGILLVVALVASWLPARRATRIDPLEALRAE
ncbi:MAG: ADOP family duplicated permease [Gemmatimonadaceae bacterium]